MMGSKLLKGLKVRWYDERDECRAWDVLTSRENGRAFGLVLFMLETPS
jgi:hypothetical protein